MVRGDQQIWCLNGFINMRCSIKREGLLIDFSEAFDAGQDAGAGDVFITFEPIN